MGFKLAMYSTAAVLTVTKALSDVYQCIYEKGHTKALQDQGRMVTFSEFRDITDEEFWKEEYFFKPEDLKFVGNEPEDVRAKRSRMFTGANDTEASPVAALSVSKYSDSITSDLLSPHPPTSSPKPSASKTTTSSRTRKMSCASAYVPENVAEAMDKLDII